MMRLLSDNRFILGLYVLIGVIVGIQRYHLGPDHYNNYLIFQHSVFHFFSHQNPYLEYPAEYFDVFLYNPTFIVLFLPFAYLPHYLGLILFSVAALVVYFVSISTLPFPQRAKVFLLYLIIPEILTTLANLQTNIFIAAFTVLSVTLLAKKEHGKASVFPSLNFFIKGYGAVVGVFFLLENPRIKTFMYLIVSFLILGALPLLFYSWNDFMLLYQQWFVSLANDYSINTGLSVMGLVRSLIDKDASILFIQLTGAAFFLLTFLLLLYRKNYETVRYQLLAYVMLWMIIFNQASESPTYIIASTGGFIWYLTARKSPLTIALFVFFYVLTVLSSSDLFPVYIRNNYVSPYCLKALPCLLIWVKIQYDFLVVTPQPAYTLHEEKS